MQKPPPLFIGLGHRSKVGKDTLAKMLLLHATTKGMVTCIRSWADPLYHTAHYLYGWTGFQTKEYYDANPTAKDIELEPLEATPRELLIRLGTKAIRNHVHPNTWVEWLMQQDYTGIDLVIIPDTRFDNELLYIKDQGGMCIKVERAKGETHGIDSTLSHYPWDFTIYNNGTLEELFQAAGDIIKKCQQIRQNSHTSATTGGSR